jgi:arylsulfatase A-like enzyme
LLAAARQPRAAKHEVHGVSILPLLLGESFAREGALHWENQHNAAVLAGEWKLVHRYWLKQPLLYRLSEDPGEDRDLAARHPEKAAELLALHERWKARHYPNAIPRELKRSSYTFPATTQDP